MPRRVLIVAGEASGDTHGAHLVSALREQEPDVEIFGLGGNRMRKAGVDVVFDSSLVAVVGASEVLANLGVILRVLRWIQAALDTVKPDLVILIDFPDFNFRVARAAKKSGVPVFYYISPQIWAWRRGRAKFLAKTVEGLAVIFPFEAELYQKWGLPAEYVGHPIMDGPQGAPPDRDAARKKLGLEGTEPVIALLPGSRNSELHHNLPRLLESATKIAAEIPGARFLLPAASTVDHKKLAEHIAATSSAKVRVVPARECESHDVLAASDAAAVKSGTSTVEAALAGVPFVIVYRVSRFTWEIGSRLVKVPFVGMVNLIAGKEVARELLQSNFTPENVAREVIALLRDPARRAEAQAGIASVREKLGTGGASKRAAEMAARVLARHAPRPVREVTA